MGSIFYILKQVILFLTIFYPMRFLLFLLTGVVYTSGIRAQLPAKPFPQHVQYHVGVIKPSHITQRQMDDSVRSFYAAWKKRYIHGNCGEGQYYTWFDLPGSKQCVSEGQGYGMIIVAMMAGFDASAKTSYDG